MPDGILKVNGFDGFLANYGQHKTADDPVRDSLGLLGSLRCGEWLRVEEWVFVATEQGVVKKILPRSEMDSCKSKERAIVLVHRELDKRLPKLRDSGGFESMRCGSFFASHLGAAAPKPPKFTRHEPALDGCPENLGKPSLTRV